MSKISIAAAAGTAALLVFGTLGATGAVPLSSARQLLSSASSASIDLFVPVAAKKPSKGKGKGKGEFEDRPAAWIFF